MNLFGALMWTAAPFTIFAGLTTDFIASRFVKAGNKRNFGTIKAILIFAANDCILGLLMIYLQFRQTYESTVILIFIMNLYRSWNYGFHAMFVKAKYPAEFFGRLMGCLRISMGLTNILVIPLAKVSKFSTILSLFAALQALSLSFPAYSLYKLRLELKNEK